MVWGGSEIWEGDFEVWARGVLPVDDFNEAPNYVRVGVSDIVILMDVLSEVVQLRFPLLDNEFPVALTHCHLVCLPEFPVEEVMGWLSALAGERGGERDAVESIVRESGVEVGVRVCADDVAESWQYIIERELMFAHGGLFDSVRPADNERDADAPFMA